VSHLEILETELQRFRIDLSTTEKLKLAMYCDELGRWNNRLNLTSLVGTHLVRRLIVEPVWIGRALMPRGVLVDIGSGNGSPAIPLHIISQFAECHLIEVRTKRAAFLRHIVPMLELCSTVIHRGRFEDVAPNLNKIDWITLQGLALTRELLGSIRESVNRTTTIVWITSLDTTPPIPPNRVLHVPTTNTQVALFHLDQS